MPNSVLASAAAFLAFATATSTLSPAAARSQSQPPAITSLLGRTLTAPALPPEAAARMEAQRAEALSVWERDRANPDALIWVGRRTAYLGRYMDAIRVFTDGVLRHPDDARMYRHRGHRYLSVRQIDRAIADLERAAELIAGQPDQVEPDGQPNARNIPTSTLHSNVYYHLALGYYLKGDFSRASDTWTRARDAVDNPDNLVAASAWLYVSLRRAGRTAEAATVLARITPDLDVIENGSYHQLLLLHKGERTLDQVLAAAGAGASGAAVRYGVSAWHLVNGRDADALAMWNQILEGQDWASFGFLAAEAEVAARRTR